jgi:competence ComEA-like helix-hairpin-helix protein
MTERKENVEPPLASRRVQITLAVLASVTLGWLLMTTRRHPPSGPPHDIAEQIEGGLGESVLLRIDLNVAEPRELALLPGVGPILASRIAENRIRLGPFTSLDDLSRVHGIGPKTLDRIREICVVDSRSAAIHGDERLASVRDFAESEQTGSFDPAGR